MRPRLRMLRYCRRAVQMLAGAARMTTGCYRAFISTLLQSELRLTDESSILEHRVHIGPGPPAPRVHDGRVARQIRATNFFALFSEDSDNFTIAHTVSDPLIIGVGKTWSWRGWGIDASRSSLRSWHGGLHSAAR